MPGGGRTADDARSCAHSQRLPRKRADVPARFEAHVRRDWHGLSCAADRQADGRSDRVLFAAAQRAFEGDVMNFLSPAFLIGLPLVAVPVIIHLLSRRQQKKISWGAMRFLMQAATRKRRLFRLTDLLLLLLRTAAFLFFIFALARPLLPATWLGGGVPRQVILVLDQSMSMSRKVNGTTLFDLQLQKADAFLGDLKASDTIRVLLAGESPEWLTTDRSEERRV